MRIYMQSVLVSKPLFALRETRMYTCGAKERSHKMLQDKEDSREAVAARLKRVREILGLDQKEFAQGAGLLPQTYGPFETGKRDLSLEAAKRLRKAYNLPLEFMYFGKIDDLPHKIAASL